MTTKTLKKELHEAIDQMPDTGFLKAVHALFKEYSLGYDNSYVLNASERTGLDEQKKLHLAGKSKSYSLSEVRKRARLRLKNKQQSSCLKQALSLPV
jgi:hypothetical protein